MLVALGESRLESRQLPPQRAAETCSGGVRACALNKAARGGSFSAVGRPHSLTSALLEFCTQAEESRLDLLGLEYSCAQPGSVSHQLRRLTRAGLLSDLCSSEKNRVLVLREGAPSTCFCSLIT